MMRATILSALMLSPVSATAAGPDMAYGAAPDPSPGTASPGAVPPMVVTSDTGAYCDTLSRQLDRRGAALPQRVASLRDQGQHLCAIGQVRGGINRLRRALMALRDPDGAGDEPDEPAGGENGR